MQLKRSWIGFAFFAVAVISVVGCGGSNVKCGDGTELSHGRCVIPDGGGAYDAGNPNKPDSGGSAMPSNPKCGKGTTAVNGECVPVDAGTPPPAPAKSPVGSACMSGDDCDTGFCAPASDTLPGGLCTVINCSMTNPCPLGSTCYNADKSMPAVCLQYCDREASCRTSENYHCQPYYATAINVCAPSCTLTKKCNAGTRCNADTGLCELAECDPASPGSDCTDQETCYPDSKGLSSKGGLCLHLCDPAHPENACLVEKSEVCQPLAEDPATMGFCAPPVCSKTEECPAGAICQNSVCQPPALCDSNGACADATTTCVSGKQCMPKCPTDGSSCSDIHSGLVCADVLAVPACLPKGSFPGSDCRASDKPCDGIKTNDHSADMVCHNGKCLAECGTGTGGQDLCTELSDTLICASGIFPEDVCLPKGTFPGGPCGDRSTCAQGLNGNNAVNMSCIKGTCLITCSETGEWAGYGDALCKIVDPSLTCATKAGAICVKACSSTGGCDTGFSCLDPGTVPAHENSCLPNGSFPDSPCRTTSNDQCDQDLTGDGTVNLVCVSSSGKCEVSCPGDNDNLCQQVDPRLTCSESASNICVFACGNAGACPTDFSCLDAGGAGHQNACLPTGSFPGSPCRSTSGDQCDAHLGGSSGPAMSCSATNVCVVDCPGSDEAANDAVCMGVSSLLTCSESAGHVCVLACGQSGACPTGFACLDAGGNGHQNACLPEGTFPGSPCRSDANNKCDAHLGGGSNGPALVCSATDVCVVDCSGSDEAANDALCAGVSPALTCSESAGHVCVLACQNGACGTGFSCLDPGGNGHQNACLPDGTFPGSACRSDANDKCDAHLGGGSTGPAMLCSATNVCVVDCSGGSEVANDALCAAVSPALTCSESAGHVCVLACQSGACGTGFSCLDAGGSSHQNACLPNGTFPGSTCRTDQNNQCDAHLGGGSSGPAMSCSSTNVCVVDCPGADEAVNDALCAAVNPALTCSESAGHVCVLACQGGACLPGFSCLDAGGSGHQNACLPDGTFPGSTCRTDQNNQCDAHLGGGSSGPAMSCSSTNVCVVDCPGADEAVNDALCAAVNPALTCSESAGHVCVLACGPGGACGTGFSCLDPGGSGHQNACLPDGTFPGSTCRTDQNNQCDAHLGGGSGPAMSCSAANVCVVDCPGADETVNDALCAAVNPALTCSESAGHICVLACQSGACLSGYACLDPGTSGHENACLPTGSFPGSPCAPGNLCAQNLNGDSNADMVCVAGTCVVDCSNGGNTTCTDVSPLLICSANAGNLCVPLCQQGVCPTGLSCLLPGVQDECLPDGSFPGSTCRTQAPECDQQLNGVANANMVCDSQSDKCVLPCPTNDDALCNSVNPALTCFSTDNICLIKCTGTLCSPGFTCDTSTGENVCLPN